MRDHIPVVIDKFNWLWDRGNPEETPLDHFSLCQDLKFIGGNTFASRDGIVTYQTVTPITNVRRMYDYPTDTGATLLVLNDVGAIYHVISPTLMYGPILIIAGMTDFSFVPFNGRAYITPFFSEILDGQNRERGMQNEYVYVYKGDGSLARRAGGAAPTTAITVVNSGPGHNDGGIHIFGYVYETDTGYLTAPGGLVSFLSGQAFAFDFSTIANSPDSFVVKKHLVASKVISNFNGDVNGYDLFFIPNATINDNTTTSLSGISFYDQDLLDDATHLKDNFANIPAGVKLTTYHNRLVVHTPYDNISIGYASEAGEPEAVNQITGLLTVTPDGNPLTNCAPLRDVLYFFKRNKTYSFVDTGDDPSTWPLSTIDNALGCGVHGIATVIDSGSASSDSLIVGSYKGMVLFNGSYILPELTWKVQNKWITSPLESNGNSVEIVNDPVRSIIYCLTAGLEILYGDYSNGYDPKSIRWCPWVITGIRTISMTRVSTLLTGGNSGIAQLTPNTHNDLGSAYSPSFQTGYVGG